MFVYISHSIYYYISANLIFQKLVYSYSKRQKQTFLS